MIHLLMIKKIILKRRLIKVEFIETNIFKNKKKISFIYKINLIKIIKKNYKLLKTQMNMINYIKNSNY